MTPERVSQFRALFDTAALESMKLFAEDLKVAEPADVMNFLQSMAVVMLDAHRVACATLVAAEKGTPELSPTLFSVALARMREHGDGEARNRAEAISREAVTHALRLMPDTATDEQILEVHLYCLRQFAFACMAETMNARPIRAIVDQGIHHAIRFKGQGGKA